MPLFSGKFNPRASRARKSQPLSSRSFDPESDLIREFKSIELNLGDDTVYHFDDTKGEWIQQPSDSGKKTKKETNLIKDKNELIKLKKTNEALLEENRLLKLKVELLVDLVIEKGENLE